MAHFTAKRLKRRRSLKYKLMLAFSLMSIIPILSCMYLVSSYLFPAFHDIVDVSVVLFLSIIISILGLIMARNLIDPVIDMAIEAKIIAGGEYDRRIIMSTDDEIEGLGDAINLMTQKIKSNLDELRDYGQRTKEVDAEIHKRILVLSNLLQISDIVSSRNAELDTVLDIAVQKAASIFETGFGILYMARPKTRDFIVKASYDVGDEKLIELVIKEGGQGLLEKALHDRSILIIDDSTKHTKHIDEWTRAYSVKNLLAMPLFSGRTNLGLLVLGNRMGDFKFRQDDIDMVKVFAKQITLSMENDMLFKRAEELTIMDELTGLFNKNYILMRLEDEIKRSIFYQRPCSFVLINVDGFKTFRDSKGQLMSEETLKKMSRLIRDSAPPLSKIARMSGDEFAMILPEKNKKEAAGIAEEIRKRFETFNFAKEGDLKFTVSIGVTENPIDGSTKEEIFQKAVEALRSAKAAGKNRVIA